MNILQQINEGMSAVVDHTLPSIVRLSDGSSASGSGTIWHSDGLIITNAHVVAGRQLVATLHSGEDLPVQVLAMDKQLDVAALAVDARDLPTIVIGDSHALKPGDWVLALGHPWGIRNSLTSGVVIGTGDALPEMPRGRDWIALSLHLRPGHSGGPLLNAEGKLVGINTMITGPDVGFAIPAHLVKQFLRETIGKAAAV